MSVTNVFTLLQLPKTSNGFSSVSTSGAQRSGEPLHKVARTDTDLDSASASRSGAGTTRIRIVGGQTRSHPLKDPFYSIRNNISIILTPFERPVLSESYEAIYLRTRYIVCIDGKGQGLYENLKKEIDVCVGQISRTLTDQVSLNLNYMGRLCDWFHSAVDLLRSLLSPLDQIFVPSVNGTPNIQTLAYSLFNERVFGYSEIAKKLRASLRSWTDADREKSPGERPSRASVRHLLKHLIAHDVYFGPSNYEEFLLKATEEYYSSYAQRLADIIHDDPAAFFDNVYDAIEEEQKRAEEVFPSDSQKAFKESTQLSLFILGSASNTDTNREWLTRLEWLATPKTIAAYIDDDSIATLGKMYRLFNMLDEITHSRLPLKVLSNAWKGFVHNMVSAIVKSTSVESSDSDESMVPNLLKFKARVEEVLHAVFITREEKTDTNFTRALSDGFTSGFKTRRLKPAEMLAKYLDGMMRKGQAKFYESLSKSSSAAHHETINTQSNQDTVFQSHLLRVLALYRFSEDKDVFRTFYHRQLAKRLLLGRSASSDAEAGMLKMLKEQYDPEFDMGEQMFKDLSLSAEMTRDFREKSGDSNLEVRVLQRSAWPFTLGKKQIVVTDEMQHQLSTFSNFYHSEHGNRKLDWDHALGTMSLKTRFRPQDRNVVEKELSVSLYQGVILLMFQEKNKISYTEIKEMQHSLDNDDLRRTLQSLACGKKKVLRKSPPGRDVFDGDVFWFHDDFVTTEEGKKAGYRIHVNSIQAKVSVKESTTTNRHIQDDRKHMLDAAIVRIMKAKKTLAYNELTMQAVDAVKNHFAPEVDEVKRRIEALVEGEYLERDERKKGVFKYVA